MIWRLATRADPAAALVADRHYSRQKPGTPQFMPTGSALVLYSNINGQEAVWGTSWPLEEYTKHEWAGAWACTIFRNETMARASGMIRNAVAATRFHYGEPPAQGMVTFVDEAAVRDKSHPGHAFIIAGFRVVGRTKRREYLALVLRPDRMPRPQPALGMQHGLELAA